MTWVDEREYSNSKEIDRFYRNILCILLLAAFMVGIALTVNSFKTDKQPAGCYIEPSDTPVGYEIIKYPKAETHSITGFQVNCPENVKINA